MIKAAGSGQFIEGSKIMIRMVNRGCTNRPFWHIIAQEVCEIYAIPETFLNPFHSPIDLF